MNKRWRASVLSLALLIGPPASLGRAPGVQLIEEAVADFKADFFPLCLAIVNELKKTSGLTDTAEIKECIAGMESVYGDMSSLLYPELVRIAAGNVDMKVRIEVCMNAQGELEELRHCLDLLIVECMWRGKKPFARSLLENFKKFYDEERRFSIRFQHEISDMLDTPDLEISTVRRKK